MRSPIIKFINQSVMYLVFLLLMFMESVMESSGIFRRNDITIESIFRSSNSCLPYIDQIGSYHNIKANIREASSFIEFLLFIFVMGESGSFVFRACYCLGFVRLKEEN